MVRCVGKILDRMEDNSAFVMEDGRGSAVTVFRWNCPEEWMPADQYAEVIGQVRSAVAHRVLFFFFQFRVLVSRRGRLE